VNAGDDETAEASSSEDANDPEMQDDDNNIVATVQVNESDVEVPFYGNEKKANIIKNKLPGRPPKPGTQLYNQLKAFMQKVVVLLVTINENEIWCGLNYMTPPVSSSGSKIPAGNKNRPINFYDQKLNALLTLGMFGEHKTALIQAKMGDDARVEIENALTLLPNAQLVAGVGVAYGRKEKTQFGDVLVATTIDGIGNVRWDNGNLYFYQGDNRYTRTEERAIQVFGRQVEDFATLTGFKVTKQGRAPKIHPKLIVSAPWLVNDLDVLNKIIHNDPRAVGGEMEGQIIAGIHNDFLGLNPPRKIDAIIIKGVADYADGMKHKGWQMTAGLAAVGYTAFKLKKTNGQVCKSNLTPQVEVASSKDCQIVIITML
jgi:nucleoside phosphorylase